jgi:hypothetical protein
MPRVDCRAPPNSAEQSTRQDVRVYRATSPGSTFTSKAKAQAPRAAPAISAEQKLKSGLSGEVLVSALLLLDFYEFPDKYAQARARVTKDGRFVKLIRVLTRARTTLTFERLSQNLRPANLAA